MKVVGENLAPKEMNQEFGIRIGAFEKNN